MQLGYKIGVGGTITYPRASKTRAVMAQLPLSALLLETDAPDMPLNGFQGQPNRPERAARVFSTLCELRPEPAEEIANTLIDNTNAILRSHNAFFGDLCSFLPFYLIVLLKMCELK